MIADQEGVLRMKANRVFRENTRPVRRARRRGASMRRQALAASRSKLTVSYMGHFGVLWRTPQSLL